MEEKITVSKTESCQWETEDLVGNLKVVVDGEIVADWKVVVDGKVVVDVVDGLDGHGEGCQYG